MSSDRAPSQSDQAASTSDQGALTSDQGASTTDGPLHGFDVVLAGVAERDRAAVERAAEMHEEEQVFLAEFERACTDHVRPAMEAVLARLSADGGGGSIEEHPGGEPRVREPRLILWMSLEGPLVGEPRRDRYPYLQLDADPVTRNIVVSEGDMWQGVGGRTSGRVGTWALGDATGERITQELLAVATRAAALGPSIEADLQVGRQV